MEDAAFAESKFDKYSIAPDEYVCDACPRGYAGSHCERYVRKSIGKQSNSLFFVPAEIPRCANGYYGNPLKVGDTCKPCDCSGNANPYAPNWCDHRTGECLQVI